MTLARGQLKIRTCLGFSHIFSLHQAAPQPPTPYRPGNGERISLFSLVGLEKTFSDSLPLTGKGGHKVLGARTLCPPFQAMPLPRRPKSPLLLVNLHEHFPMTSEPKVAFLPYPFNSAQNQLLPYTRSRALVEHHRTNGDLFWTSAGCHVWRLSPVITPESPGPRMQVGDKPLESGPLGTRGRPRPRIRRGPVIP